MLCNFDSFKNKTTVKQKLINWELPQCDEDRSETTTTTTSTHIFNIDFSAPLLRSCVSHLSRAYSSQKKAQILHILFPRHTNTLEKKTKTNRIQIRGILNVIIFFFTFKL